MSAMSLVSRVSQSMQSTRLATHTIPHKAAVAVFSRFFSANGDSSTLVLVEHADGNINPARNGSGWDNNTLLDYVFSSGEARLQILMWLFTLYDPLLFDTTLLSTSRRDAAYSEWIGNPDDLLNRLLFSAHLMGLADRDEVALIKGSDHIYYRHVQFLRTLMDMAKLSATYPTDGRTALQHPFGDIPFSGLKEPENNGSMSLDDITWCYCSMLDGLGRKFDVKDLFRTDCNVFNHMAPFSKNTGVKSNKNMTRQALLHEPKTRLLELSKNLRITQRNIHEVDEELYSLRDTSAHPLQFTASTESLYSGTDEFWASMERFSENVSSFNYVFNRELTPWVDAKRPPELRGLGQLAHDVQVHLDEVQTFVDAYAKVRKTYNETLNEVETKVAPLNEAIDMVSSDATLRCEGRHGVGVPRAVDELMEAVSVFEQSVSRMS